MIKDVSFNWCDQSLNLTYVISTKVAPNLPVCFDPRLAKLGTFLEMILLVSTAP